MKTRVSLSIDKDVLSLAKQYATKNKVSLSVLVENYLRKISKEDKSETLIEFVKKLPTPKIDENINFKKQYYEERAEKYGFKK